MQLLTESLMLAVLGLTGLAIAQWGGGITRRALLDQAPHTIHDCSMASLLAHFDSTAIVPGGTTYTSLRWFPRGHDQARAATLLTGCRAQSCCSSAPGCFSAAWSTSRTFFGYDPDRLLWVESTSSGTRSTRFTDTKAPAAGERRRFLSRDSASRALTVPFYMTWQLSLLCPASIRFQTRRLHLAGRL